MSTQEQRQWRLVSGLAVHLALVLQAGCSLEPRYELVADGKPEARTPVVRIERRNAIVDDPWMFLPDSGTTKPEVSDPVDAAPPAAPVSSDAGDAEASPEPPGTEPQIDSGAPTGNHCWDSRIGEGETAVDCGGECPPCVSGRTCLVDADCESRRCEETCRQPTCFDERENGDETDVDCGGSCAPCAVGLGCRAHSDCETSRCFVLAGLCVAATCDDFAENGDETDVDCGGSCAPCAVGLGCRKHSDCETNSCFVLAEQCVEITCDDGAQNGDESDVDCGGSGACERCVDGSWCTRDADCASNYCSPETQRCRPSECLSSTGAAPVCGDPCDPCPPVAECPEPGNCPPPECSAEPCASTTCDDGKNGSETGVDCGGANSCPRCPVGESCLLDGDCESGYCPSQRCAPSAESCTDNRVNGNETGIDCGGSDCPACSPGRPCAQGTDCSSGRCENGACSLE